MAKIGRPRVPEGKGKIPFSVRRDTAEKLRQARALGKGVDEALDICADRLLEGVGDE